jgi:hypothetical protein
VSKGQEYETKENPMWQNHIESIQGTPPSPTFTGLTRPYPHVYKEPDIIETRKGTPKRRSPRRVAPREQTPGSDKLVLSVLSRGVAVAGARLKHVLGKGG